MNATLPADVWTKAREATGNWKKFESFGASSDIEDTDFIHILGHRDERLIGESNRLAIEAELTKVSEATNGNFWLGSSRHWAVGCTYDVVMTPILMVDSEHPAEFLNPVFEKLAEISRALEEYPVLDETDYCQREYDATIENIKSEFGNKMSDEAPEDWAEQVFSWLFDYDQEAVENRDDQGGWPTEEQIRNALAEISLEAAGWIDED